jgi:hypothetical protein
MLISVRGRIAPHIAAQARAVADSRKHYAVSIIDPAQTRFRKVLLRDP